MKKLILLFVSLLALTACEGDRGPQGPPGEDGTGGMLGQTYELEDINFQYQNDTGIYTDLEEVPSDITVKEADAILVYRLEGQANLDDGSTADEWTQLPHNFFLNDGTAIQYGFTHTFVDVRLFIDASNDISNLDSSFTDNQIFRFVVVPSKFSNDPNNDLSTYGSLLKAADQGGIQIKSLN